MARSHEEEIALRIQVIREREETKAKRSAARAAERAETTRDKRRERLVAAITYDREGYRVCSTCGSDKNLVKVATRMGEPYYYNCLKCNPATVTIFKGIFDALGTNFSKKLAESYEPSDEDMTHEINMDDDYK